MLKGRLQVDGTSTFNGLVTMNQFIANRAFFNGDVTVNGVLRFGPTGKIDLGELLAATPSLLTVGQLTVTQSASITGTLTVSGMSTVAGIEATSIKSNTLNIISTAVIGGGLHVSATITANYFVGDGSKLTGIAADGAWTRGDQSINYPDKVGIGVATPVAPLSIGNSSIPGADGYLAFGKNDGSISRMIRLGLDSAFNFVIGDFGTANTAGDWIKQFKLDYRAPNNSIAIDSIGNVGIGLSQPSVKLDVAGVVRATSFTGSGAGLSNVLLTALDSSGATSGQVLQWNGTAWAPATITVTSSGSGDTGGSTGSGTASSGTPAVVSQTSLTVSASVTTIDWTKANVVKLQMTGINTALNFVNPQGPTRLMIIIDYQVLTDVTWPLAPLIKWAGGIIPSLTNSQTQGSVDIVSLYFDGTTYYGSVGTNFR